MAKSKKKSGNGMMIGVLVAIVVVVLLVIIVFSGGSKYDSDDVDRFAQCLTEQGAVMYGAYWCPHCAQTKKSFGSSFRYITYVECDPNGDDEQSEFCIEKGIEKYDTWEFADGSRIYLEPSFQELADKTGCEAPQELD